MAVLAMTPSLGPNLCYWSAENELSTGREKELKGFEMVNGTQQWPIEEIYITNCVCADCRSSACNTVFMGCVLNFLFIVFACFLLDTQPSLSLFSLRSARVQIRVLVNKRCHKQVMFVAHLHPLRPPTPLHTYTLISVFTSVSLSMD